jgi:hypothetical protein
VRTTRALVSGGLRYAATTGYYLAALQAEFRGVFPLAIPRGDTDLNGAETLASSYL